MRVDVTVSDPSHENYGVEIVSDGTNPVQLVLRTHQRTYRALLSAEEARRLATALGLAAAAAPECPASTATRPPP